MSEEPTTLLGRWMKANEISDKELAPKIGVSRVHVSRLRRGIYTPPRDLALRLQEVTQIPAADFVFEQAA